MPIDPTQISEKQFSAAVRGWNRDEVRQFLAEIAASFVPVLEERDRLRRSEAAQRVQLTRLGNEVKQLQAEAEGYRSRATRSDWNEADMLADVGNQVSDLLSAAAGTGAQIREQAERYAATIRRKALDEATAIGEQSQSRSAEIEVARQQVSGAADNVRRVEAAEMTASAAARREVLSAAARITSECGRLRNVAGHLGTPAGTGSDPVAAIDDDIRKLQEDAARPGWPLPEALDPSSPLLRPDGAPPAAGEVPGTPAIPAADEPDDPDDQPAGQVAGLLASGHPAAPQAPSPLRIAVLGAGHVGLTTAACLAQMGHTVTCTDHASGRVQELALADPPFMEPGLDELVSEGTTAKRLSFSTDNAAAAAAADIVLLCLPTPEGADGRADVTALAEAVQVIGPHRRPGAVVAGKSSMPVGTCRSFAGWLGRTDVAVVSNPEFLREGAAVSDFFHPDRVVIGADDPQAAEKVAGLYRPLGTELMIVRTESAELVKYASNALLACRLSYINDIATLCELVRADIAEVIAGMAADRRISPFFLDPGPGWGGSCFPKDTTALVRIAGDAGFDFQLLRAAVTANRAHQDRLASRIAELAGEPVEGRTVAVWGLTFKAGTDDLRSSPSLAIAAALRERGAIIQAYDPTIHVPIPGIKICASPLAAGENASVLFVATEWEECGEVDLADLRQVMAQPAIVAGRRRRAPAAAGRHGFTYAAVGQPAVVQAGAAPGTGSPAGPGPLPGRRQEGTLT